MKTQMNTTRKSKRIVAIVLLTAVFASIALAFEWDNVKTFGTKLFVSSVPALPAPKINDDFALLSCDTAMPIEVEVGGVGTGYGTLAAAIAAINAGTHTGAITIEVCANTTETAAIVLNSSGAGSANYTALNIYPLIDNATIAGPTVMGRGLIELNGADNVTIDGDNPLTANTNRNLTITNTATSTTTLTSVIRIAVTTTTVTSADNIIIRNLNLNGSATGRNISTATSTSASENNTFGIYAGGNASGATSAPSALTSVTSNTAASGTTINSLQISNNALNACARAIVFNGAAATVSTGVTVSNNLVGDQNPVTGDPPYTTPNTTVYTKGIYIQGTNAITISGNTVRNIISYVPTAITAIELVSAIGSGIININNNNVNGIVTNSVAGTSSIYGILLSSAGGPYTISGNTVSNVQLVSTSFTPKPRGVEVNTGATSGTIEKNRISAIYNRSTGTGGVYGINLVGGNNIIVQNNFVWDINENMTGGSAFGTTFGVYGIRVAAGTGHKIYHNSVNLFGTLFGTAASSISTGAFAITATTLTGLDVRNNIFSNTLNGGTTSIAHVSMLLPSSGTSTMNLTLNNNNYFSGTTTGSQGIAHVGTTYTATPAGPTTYAGLYTAANFNPSDTTATNNLRTYTNVLSSAATNDNTSKVVDPLYVSSTDLHIQSASPMESMGANVSVADDIDGDSRGATPDIGADEITLAGPGTVQFSTPNFTDTEGNSATITVTRSGGVTGGISVDYATSNGTASSGVCGSGGDYVSAMGTLNWTNGDSAAKTFTVQLCSDASAEPTETVSLTLSNPVGTTISGTNPATLNITDNPPGTVQFSATTYSGNEGTLATITATRTGGSSGAVTVDYATSAGTATGGASCTGSTDFVNATGTLSWSNNDSASKTFNVTLCSDTSAESTETVNLALSNPTGGVTIGANSTATLNINDVASQFCNADGTISIPSSGTSTPYPSVINVSGLTGTTNTVRVTLNSAQHTDMTDLDILLVSPTGQKFILLSDASSNAGLDLPATLTFSDAGAILPTSGQLTSGTYQPRDVTSGDTFAAPAPSGPYSSPASVGTATLNGTFMGANPNGNWSLYVVDDASGDSGTIPSWCLEITTIAPNPGTVQFNPATYAPNENTTATITVTRTGGTLGSAAVDYATSDNTATAGTCGSGGDYVAASGTLTWADGESGAKTFEVPICPDTVLDNGETVNLTLSNPVGTTLGANSTGTITINDVPPPSVQFNPTAYAGNEGSTVTVTVTRTGDTNVASSVNYATSDNTATAGVCGSGGDYVPASGTLNFTAGQTSHTFTIQLCSDLIVDPAETLNLTLSSPTGAVLGTNSTATLTITDVPPPLSGDYNVGVGQPAPFNTITAAVAALNSRGVSGATTLTLTDTTYNTASGETFPISINQISGASSTNTITIKPAAGVTPTIIGSGSPCVLRLNGADFVTIDGSNTPLGTTRDLTISNTSSTASTAAVCLVSLGTGAGATDNTIRNTKLLTGSTTATTYGVAVGGSTIGNSGADNDNNTIQNNESTTASVGIYAVGTTAASAGGNDNLNIVGNSISSTTTTTLTVFGIRVGSSLNSSVSQNTVSVETSANVAPVGISLETGFVSSLVNRNNISKVRTTATGGYGGRGITVGTGTATSNLTVRNNFVSGVNGSDWTNFTNSSSMGIALGVIGTGTTLTTITGGVNLYHNSVNMYGASTFSGNTLTAALYAGSGASALDVRNNIFSNRISNTTVTGAGPKNYAIYSAAANTAFTAINFNDYYVEGTQGVLGFLGSDRTTLAEAQTGFGGNTNSISANPLYVSNSDLHIQTANVYSQTADRGTPIPGVTVDYDNETRSGTTPDIGADEFADAPTSGDPIAAGTYSNLAIVDGQSLGGNVTVLGVLTLNGKLFANTFDLTIGCGGTIAGGGTSSFVVGNLTKQFCSTGSFTFPVGTAIPPIMVGQLGSSNDYTPFTANVTALGANPSSLKVNVVKAFLGGSSNSESIQRYWDVTETGDLTADISFTYLQDDVNGTETAYKVLRRSGTTTANCEDTVNNPCGVTTASVNADTNTGSATGVSTFSQWSAGNLAPSSANVTVGGRVVTASGRGIYQARVVMVEPNGETRLARTNPFGYYRFTNVASGNTYIFSAFHKTYQFVEPSIIRSVNGDDDGIVFVASGSQPNASANQTYFDKTPFDFDGDGISDVSVWRASENSWYIRRSSDNTWTVQPFGLPSDKLAPADFDGDGITDLAVFRPAEGNWYIWLSRSNSLRVERLGTNDDVPMPTDFDGDGIADLAVWRTGKNSFVVKRSSDESSYSIELGERPTAVKARTGDFDGNGKSDIALFSNERRTWEVVYAGNSAGKTIEVAGKGEVPVAADFDGDGRTDLGVFDSQSGAWTVRLSRNGEFVQFQTAPGIPVVGDFEGDGRIDAGTFRDGLWAIRQSVTNSVRSRVFGTDSDFPVPSAIRD